MLFVPQNALFIRHIYWNMFSYRGFPILHDELYEKILPKSPIFSQVEYVFPFISKVLWQWHIYKRNWYAYELITTFLKHTLSRAVGGEDTFILFVFRLYYRPQIWWCYARSRLPFHASILTLAMNYCYHIKLRMETLYGTSPLVYQSQRSRISLNTTNTLLRIRVLSTD